jgi:hypothetical protein
MRGGKLMYLGRGAAGVAVLAMVADTSLYVAGGSHGEAPDQAKVTLTVASSGAYSPLNLQVTQFKALEPDFLVAERYQPTGSELRHFPVARGLFKLS